MILQDVPVWKQFAARSIGQTIRDARVMGVTPDLVSVDVSADSDDSNDVDLWGDFCVEPLDVISRERRLQFERYLTNREMRKQKIIDEFKASQSVDTGAAKTE